jgi:hypothetical protein
MIEVVGVLTSCSEKEAILSLTGACLMTGEASESVILLLEDKYQTFCKYKHNIL